MGELASREVNVFRVAVSVYSQEEHFTININKSTGEDFTATARPS